MSDGPRIVAVVVTWNRKELLARNLRAVLAQTRPVDEVLVVDNASTDGTPEMLAAEFPSVRVVRLVGNAGSAGGFHVGVREGLALGADWLWLMDDDGVPDQGCLAELLRVASRENFALCGPVVAALEDPTRLAVPLQDLRLSTTVEGFRSAIASDCYKCVKPPLFNGILLGAEFAKKAGPPKAEMFIWGEDNEYCERFSAAGFVSGLATNAIFWHPNLADRGWWLIDISIRGRHIRKCLLPCEARSPRFGIVARNIGFRTRRYYGILATAFVLASGAVATARRAGFVEVYQFIRYFLDGALDHYRLAPCREEIEAMLAFIEGRSVGRNAAVRPVDRSSAGPGPLSVA